MTWKVGEVARRCGVTVRALHHYEAIGLLVPWRSASGHRLYATEHVERLHRILALRQLGLGLDGIAAALDGPDGSSLAIIDRQIARLAEAIREQRSLKRRLEAIADRLRRGEPIDGENYLDAMEEMAMIEKYYTPEQLQQLAARREALGPEGMAAGEQAWRDLFADIRAAMDGGVDPKSDAARALADRWQALIGAFTGGDAGIGESLGNLWQNEGDEVMQQHQMDPAIFGWMAKVRGDD